MRRRRHLTSAATSVVVILAFTILPQPPVLRQRRNLRGALAPFLPPGVPSLLSLRRLPSSLSLSPRRLESGSALAPAAHPTWTWSGEGRDGPGRGPRILVRPRPILSLMMRWAAGRVSVTQGPFPRFLTVVDHQAELTVLFPFTGGNCSPFRTQKIQVMFTTFLLEARVL